MEKQIWNFLINNGFNAFAAAGIMGNLFAESGLRPTNVEDSSGQADATYTAQVDSGAYTNFANDRIGYGIAQWTDPSRKKKLYTFLKNKRLSIGDLNGQLEFLLNELKTDFNSLYQFLLEVNNVNEASNEFLIKFENPSDKSNGVKRRRAIYSFKYYNLYSKTTVEVKNMILKIGSKGPEVEQLQKNLIKLGYDCGEAGADGDFGQATHMAVTTFQSERGLEVDGKVGTQTQNEIAKLLADPRYKRTVKNLGRTVDKLIAIATAELGYKEKKSNSNLDSKEANAGAGNFTKYARDLAAKGYYNGSKQGYAWCDVWADWCFLQLCEGDAVAAQAMQCQTGPLGAGCLYSAQYYQQQGRWSKTPVLGAQAFFYAGGAINHTGIAVGVNGNIVTIIEGNTSEQVAKRTYNINDASIAGYGLPKYDEPASEKPVEEEQEIFTPYKVKITAKKLNVRSEPNMDSPVIKIIQQGEIKTIIAEENSFGKLDEEEGWIMLAYTKL